MQEDDEGFLYPHMDAGACIDCGLCEKVCPILTSYEKRMPIEAIAAINNDDEVRKNSSSGGIFTMLAENVINEGGVVFGARFDDQWQVVIDHTETIDGIADFRGSKYVQAQVLDTYKQCEIFLKAGRLVLYAGTPCQISGLNHFLNKEYSNLLTVDFACHGVPSPKVWRMYIHEVQRSISLGWSTMRDNSKGWQRYNFLLQYNKDDRCFELTSPIYRNDYMKAFLYDLILRPSCHHCKVKGFSSKSDITIADYWGIWNIVPEMNDDKGTSLVFQHNEKARRYFPHDGLKALVTECEQAIAYNTAIVKSSKSHRNREAFFSDFKAGKDLVKIMRKYTAPSLKTQASSLVRSILKMLKGKGNGETFSNHVYTAIPDNVQGLVKGVVFRDKHTKWQNYNITIKIQ